MLQGRDYINCAVNKCCKIVLDDHVKIHKVLNFMQNLTFKGEIYVKLEILALYLYYQVIFIPSKFERNMFVRNKDGHANSCN